MVNCGVSRAFKDTPKLTLKGLHSTFLTLYRRNVSVLYKESARTGQQTLSASVIKTDLLMTYQAKVTVSSESHTKHIHVM